MKYQANSTALSQSTDCLIIGIYENNELTKSFNEIDQITQGYLSQLAQSQDLSGKIGQATLLHSLPNLAAKRVLVAGCGKKGETTERQFKQIIQRVTQTLKELNIKQVVNNLTDVEIEDRDLFWNVRFTVETIEHSLYQFDEFKSKKADAISLQEIIFNTDDSQAQQAIAEAQAIANGVKAARNIANMPPNICTPAYLAEQAKNLAETLTALSLDVIDEEEMTKLGMNAYLAVSRGSQNPAYMSILQFNNAPDKNAKPIVLVGKGLTFDAGGISLKPAADMDEMKYDMCGAAEMMEMLEYLVTQKVEKNVMAVLMLAENVISPDAVKMGDVITTLAGKTVEVYNTDAEGRLVLCDGITFAQRMGARTVIDLATLTYSAQSALGDQVVALFGNDREVLRSWEETAEQTGEYYWQLPMGPIYHRMIEWSICADFANYAPGRGAGASVAACFLENFVEEGTQWIHLDMVGPSVVRKETDEMAEGASGACMSTLAAYLTR